MYSYGRFWRRVPNFIILYRFAVTTVKATDNQHDSVCGTETSELASKASDIEDEWLKSKMCNNENQTVSESYDPLKHFSWMANAAPCFSVEGNKIVVLSEPTEFYDTLKELAKTARKRVVLASLYLGTGPLEKDLVDCIYNTSLRCRDVEKSPLRVSILLDYMRGSRGSTNSRTMLLPLIKDFGSSVTVALYHTPMLRGIVKRLLPERYNETVGVNHIKAYIFDDTVVISGANLSESYFTNRQDRYIVLSDCPSVADFFDQLVSCLQKYSFHVNQDDTVRLADGITCHPFADYDGGMRYKAEVRNSIEKIIDPHTASLDRQTNPDSRVPDVDTQVYPLVQMGPFDVNVDEHVTSRLLQSSPPGVTMYLASGYLNLVEKYRYSIIHHCAASVAILTAAPEANGFFDAEGVSSAIPDAYTYIARKFYEEVSRFGQQNRVTLHEFSRPNWTVHAKGLWYCLPKQSEPSMSMIGSPNFGYRSVYRDLETQLVIVTKNNSLRKQLYEEQVRLYRRSEQVCEKTFSSTHRQIPRWVTLVTPLIRNFF